ncbi:MAG: D-alanyl-D-alanine carboxypeptidase family protein [Propioniciclava sp.]|uniref:M15 family metallopeptidase n=1 Tax=Propioniciclava sp. TaxID=2038686 RepID=UPI0039E5389E
MRPERQWIRTSGVLAVTAAMVATMVTTATAAGPSEVRTPDAATAIATATTTGWLERPEGRYYLNADGTKKTGWVKSGGAWYYFGSGGLMRTGWVKDGGAWYYLKASGAMATGWVRVGGSWYYLWANGVMATGWAKVGTSWYFFNSNGAMQTGWLQLRSTWYYLSANGPMLTGQHRIEGRLQSFRNDGTWLGLGVLPDHRTGSQLTKPFVVNGVALINAHHPISRDYIPTINKEFLLAPDAHDAYARMVKDAKRAGLTIVWRYGYRSYDTQAKLLASSIAKRGSRQAALRYTAAPGTSEHQLGLAVDVAAPSARGEAFAKTKEFAWLRAHAHEYGFILRYPAGKEHITGIAYEPWHYRYVGVTHAAAFAGASGLTLEEYLGGR